MHDPRTLVGHWSLERDLVDLRSGQRGRATGTLALTEGRQSLRWRESVLLTWAGRAVPAWRHYRLAPRDGAWWVHFDDGRPFHRWVLDEPLHHRCNNDDYCGRTTLAGPLLRVAWHVTGPGKDLRLHTRLSPALLGDDQLRPVPAGVLGDQ